MTLIDAEQVVRDSGWHFATAVDRLMESGMIRGDAELAAEQVFERHAHKRNDHAEESPRPYDPYWEP